MPRERIGNPGEIKTRLDEGFEELRRTVNNLPPANRQNAFQIISKLLENFKSGRYYLLSRWIDKIQEKINKGIALSNYESYLYTYAVLQRQLILGVNVYLGDLHELIISLENEAKKLAAEEKEVDEELKKQRKLLAKAKEGGVCTRDEIRSLEEQIKNLVNMKRVLARKIDSNSMSAHSAILEVLERVIASHYVH